MEAFEGDATLVPMRVTLFTAVAKLFVAAIKQLPDTRFGVCLGRLSTFRCLPIDLPPGLSFL